MRNLRIILLAFTLFAFLPSSAQKSDLDLLRSASFTDPAFSKREVKFLMSDRKNVLVKYNPVILTLGSFMYAYQSVISQQLYSSCPYHPSCSEFSVKAISGHGIIKGIFLSADRLMRCNPPSVEEMSPLRLGPDGRITDDPNQYHFHP